MTKADEALFLTYASGLQSHFASVCPGVFTTTSKTEYELTFTDENSTAAPSSKGTYDGQACHWVIESPLRTEYFIEDQSEMTLTITSSANAEIYVY